MFVCLSVCLSVCLRFSKLFVYRAINRGVFACVFRPLRLPNHDQSNSSFLYSLVLIRPACYNVERDVHMHFIVSFKPLGTGFRS